MVKTSIPAPHLHFSQGKEEGEVESKKFVKDLIWKMHLLFPFISDDWNLVILSHLTAAREAATLVYLCDYGSCYTLF